MMAPWAIAKETLKMETCLDDKESLDMEAMYLNITSRVSSYPITHVQISSRKLFPILHGDEKVYPTSPNIEKNLQRQGFLLAVSWNNVYVLWCDIGVTRMTIIVTIQLSCVDICIIFENIVTPWQLNPTQRQWINEMNIYLHWIKINNIIDS